MILTQEGRNIERSGVRVERVSSIEADAVAFDVLSNILYPDKPLAIIRELSCNAADSHARAGKKDVPFEIHLPNVLEPYLSIRDFGIGLSFRDTAVLLLTYFKSTKRGTNTETGALGLGSKTPFSYVDSYTVISRFNGRKFIFNAFKNEEGKPAIALLDRTKTDEENGIEIVVPIRRSDYDVFKHKAEVVLEWFDQKPRVTGNPNFEVSKTEYELEGSNWKLAQDPYRNGYWNAPRHHNNYGALSLAIQGNIAYPINAESMNSLPRGYADVLRHRVHFFFPIGSVGFTAGRDALSYDAKTIANVRRAIDTLIKELPSKFQAEFDKCTTIWEAKRVYGDLVNRGTTGSLFRTLDSTNKLKFKALGQEISSQYCEVDLKKFPNATISSKYRRSSTTRDAKSHDPKVTIQACEETVIVVNNLLKGGVMRFQYEMRQRGRDSGKTYYFIQSTDHSDFPKIIDELGNPPVMYTADMEKPPRSQTAQRGMFELINKGCYMQFQEMGEEEEVDIEAKGLYMPLLKGEAVTIDRRKFENFNEICHKAFDLKILTADDVIIGGNQRQIDKLKKAGWRNAYDVIVERVKERLNQNNIGTELLETSRYQAFVQSFGYMSYFMRRLGTNTEMLTDNTMVAEFAKKYANFKTDNNHQKERALAGLVGVSIDTSKAKVDYDFFSKWSDIIAKYPLISHISRPDTHFDLVVDYINMVDSQKK